MGTMALPPIRLHRITSIVSLAALKLYSPGTTCCCVQFVWCSAYLPALAWDQLNSLYNYTELQRYSNAVQHFACVTCALVLLTYPADMQVTPYAVSRHSILLKLTYSPQAAELTNTHLHLFADHLRSHVATVHVVTTCNCVMVSTNAFPCAFHCQFGPGLTLGLSEAPLTGTDIRPN